MLISSLMPPPPKVFISHYEKDAAFVEQLASDLRSRGVGVWYSPWEIMPGDSIPAKLELGLSQCEVFLIVLSKASLGRPWVLTELNTAIVRLQSGKIRKIIPVRIEECGDLPALLAPYLVQDFHNQPRERALDRVVDSIFAATGSKVPVAGGLETYLQRLIAACEPKARVYTPLQGAHAPNRAAALDDEDGAEIEVLLRHAFSRR